MGYRIKKKNLEKMFSFCETNKTTVKKRIKNRTVLDKQIEELYLSELNKYSDCHFVSDAFLLSQNEYNGFTNSQKRQSSYLNRKPF